VSSAFSIALSGLAAAGRRLDASAHDLANALTDGFTPLRVSQEEVAGGGVIATVERIDTGAEVRAHAALAGLAGVDLAFEVVGQLRAASAYRANLATLRAADEAERSLLDVLG
jgi:flagellar basal-body rod protein FlgC